MASTRRLLVTLVAVLLLVSFGAPAFTEGIVPGSLPISEEKITLTAFWPAPVNVLKFITDFNEGSVWPIIEEQTGIHIDWQHGTVEQFNLMINSGDLADIIFASDNNYKYPGGGDKAIDDGMYLRLNEILDEYCLWYNKLINSNDESKRDSRTDTGNIWAFAMYETVIQGPWMGMTVRRDWVEDLGLEMPVTYDDWYNMLVAFKNEKGAEAPLLLPKELFDWCDVFSSGYEVGQGFYQVDRQIKYGPLEPGFKEFITMLAKWYAEGLVDPDFATRDTTSVEQMRYTKKAGAWFDGFWMLEFNKQHAEDSDVYRQYAVTNPVKKKGDLTHLRQVNYNIRDEWTSVSAKSKYPVEAVRWLDNLYSDANFNLLNYGIEGEAYRMENGVPKFNPLVTANPDGLVFAEALFRYAMHDGPMHRDCYSYINSADPANPVSMPDEIDCEDIWAVSSADYVMPATISLTAEEGARSSVIMNDIKTYVTEMSARYVMGVESLDSFDKFVETINNMGIDEAINIQQAALDRYYAR